MGVTKIEWCDFTLNPWRGCTKVSAGWGPNGTRVVASEAMWREPVKWDKKAKAAGVRHRVFCASLADVFEGEDTMPPDAIDKVTPARRRLGQMILDTPNLDWLLLTKRPENVMRYARDMWCRFDDSYPLPANVWLGVSVEDQATADERIPHLLRVPATIRFLSVEPMLGPVDLMLLGGQRIHGVDWVIVGGESGHGARRFELDWARSIQSQCDKANVPWFFKQAGSNPHDWDTGDPPNYIPPEIVPLRLIDRKGGDMSEFPNNLQVREFPPPA